MTLNENLIINSENRSLSLSSAVTSARHAVGVAAIALLSPGCTLDSAGTAVFPPRTDCNKAGTCDAGQQEADVPPVDAEVKDGGIEADAELPDGDIVETGIDAGEDVSADVVVEAEAGLDANDDVSDGDVDVDADSGEAGEDGGLDADGGPVSCIGDYDPNIFAAADYVVNTDPNICSKAYAMSSNGTVAYGINDTSCQSGPIELLGVSNGDYLFVASKFWQSAAPATFAIGNSSKPITGVSVACFEIGLQPDATLNHVQAENAFNDLTFIDGYCSGTQSEPVFLSTNIDCPEPYITIHLLEVNHSN